MSARKRHCFAAFSVAFLARHMGRHIPGRPSIIVQNMPGAGTLTAANYIFSVAARDGTIMGSFSRSLPSQAVLDRPNIRFDPRQFGWIGSPETINRVCAVGAAAPAKSIDDVFAQEVLVGGMGVRMVPTYSPASPNLKGFGDSLRRRYGRRRRSWLRRRFR